MSKIISANKRNPFRDSNGKLKYVNDKGYYSLVKLLNHNGNLNIICGEKGNGKSYAMKDYMLCNFLNEGRQFFLLRRYDLDITAYKAEWYFSDLLHFKEKYGYDCMAAHYQKFYLANYDTKGNKTNSTCCGFYGSLATFQQRFSSIPFDMVGTIFLEEFAPANGLYLPNELELFEIAISTIARRREDVKIFIAGNTFDRQSIYFREYGIDIKNQKQDTIEEKFVRRTNGKITKICCEYCGDEQSNDNKLIVKNQADLNKGQWTVREYPKLEEIENYQSRYIFYVRLDETLYKCNYLVNGLNDCIYVTESVDEITEKERYISPIASPYALHSTRLIGLTQSENYIFSLIKNKKCFYSDNLTGTEFENRIRKVM